MSFICYYNIIRPGFPFIINFLVTLSTVLNSLIKLDFVWNELTWRSKGTAQNEYSDKTNYHMEWILCER